MAVGAGRQRVLPLRPHGRHVPPRRSAGHVPRRRIEPGLPRGWHGGRLVGPQGRGHVDRPLPHRRGRRMARAPPRPVRRHRAVLPARLRQPTRHDPGCRRSTGSSPSSRPADASPTSDADTAPRRSSSPRLSRWRPSPASTTTRPRSRRRGSGPPRRDWPTVSVSRSPAATTSVGAELRPGVHLRRPARHGRSGRSRTPHPEPLAPDGTWLLVEPRRGRPTRGQPPPARSHLLLGVDADLHPGVAGAAGAAPASALRPDRPASVP